MEQLNLFDIKFPVYSLPKSYEKLWTKYNVTYLETIHDTYVLDNKNMPGDTLGKRRAHINNSKLYNPRHVYQNISQFLHSKTNVFIDTLGRVFKYKKTNMVPLKYHKIKDIHRLESGECELELDVNFPIKVTCRVAYSIICVGLLHTKWGYILYSLEEEMQNDTRRKI